MDNFDLISRLQLEMRRSIADVKAETQLVVALEKGLLPDDFLVCCDSHFFREHSRDIVYTDVKEDARKRALLQMHLSRCGLYDELPEGLFFQPSLSKTNGYSAEDMASDMRQNKQKEHEIRRFFLPFENDFFWQRIQLEMEETKLLEGLQSGIMNDYFMQFWGIPSSIPKNFIVPLILFLPYTNQISGDLELTGQCLRLLLHEPVEVKRIDTPLCETGYYYSQQLGEQRLGLDMVCGEDFLEDAPVLHFVIGPLQHSAVSDYLEGGNRFQLLKTFYKFFIPAGVDANLDIEVRPEQKKMILHEGDEPVLGYTSML